MSKGQQHQANAVTGVGKGVLLTLLSQALSTGAAVVLILLTSRLLGPEGRGVLTLALLGARVLDMAISLGLGHAFMFHRAQTRWNPADVTGAAYTTWAVASLLLAAGGALLLTPARAWLPGALSAGAALLVLGITSARLLHYFLGSILLGGDRLPVYNALNVSSGTLTCVLCALAALTGKLTVATSLWAYLLGAALAATLAAWHLGPRLGRPSKELLRSCLAYGAKIQLGQTALFLNNRLDALLVGVLLPVREVGLYSAAVAVGEIIWRIPNVVSTVLYPIVARARAGEADAVTCQVSRVTQGVVMLACAAIAATASPLVWLLFGPEYRAATLTVIYLLPGMVSLSLFTLLYHDLAGRGLPGIGLKAALAGLAVTVVLDLWLIPRWGITGAAVASTVAYTTSAAWVAAGFVRHTGRRARELLWPNRTDLALLVHAWKERRGRVRPPA